MISTAKCGTRSASGGHSMWTSVLFVSVMLFCIFRPASATNPYGTKVGAIRWDGWTGDVPAFDPPEYIGQNLQQAIGLNVFQYRLPFFALPTGDYSSQINGNQDWVMDAEIVQAEDAGIDFWAFDYYYDGSGMDYGRRLYKNSSARRTLQFAYILGVGGRPTVSELTGDFQDPRYVRVNGDRPLIFLFTYDQLSTTNVDDMTTIQDAGAAAHVVPYVVVLNFDPWTAAYFASALGADAISKYATPYGNDRGAAYSDLASQERSDLDSQNWAAYNYGKKTVAWVTTGWDPRPLIWSNAWWSHWSNSWTQQANPFEIANQLQNAINWTGYQSYLADANVVLMYAWNENAEGGWLTPTYFAGADRLSAIKYVLVNCATSPLCAAPAGQQNVYRLFSPGRTDHFFSLNQDEGNGWANIEGIGFRTYASPIDSDMHPLYRCWLAGWQDHLVSADPNCEGATNEGSYGYVSSIERPGFVPLYRYFISGWLDHIVTTNPSEANAYWTYEGIIGYVPN